MQGFKEKISTKLPTGGSTPDLQAVTDAGNTTSNDINITSNKGVDFSGYIYLHTDEYGVIRLEDVAGGKTAAIDLTLIPTGTRSFQLPDNDGTIALLSDITGGSGITRSINNISGNTTAGATAATDYVYFCSGTFTLTLPTCVSNTNRYTVKCISGTLTIACNGAETIDGTATISVAVEDSVDIISNNTEWKIV
jgi:hypothetical protein